MSIQSEIERIQGNVAATYSELEDMGADMPETQNTDNLPETVGTIKAVRYDKQTLTEDQKAQARENVGAASQKAVDSLSKEIADKLPKNQGSENVGKILVVGTDGNLILTDMPEGGTSGDITGVVDEANNILLSGELADGVYLLKYENDNGTYTEIGTLTVGGLPSYTNIVPTLTDTDLSTIYNGKGYKEGYRINSSGAEVTQSGVTLTGMIPIKPNDVLHIKSDTKVTAGTPSTAGNVVYYSGSNFGATSNYSAETSNWGTDANGDLTYTAPSSATSYIRLILGNVSGALIITKNELIG